MPVILRRMLSMLPCVSLLALLAGCGQKGDLYLPSPKAATQTAPAAATGTGVPAHTE